MSAEHLLRWLQPGAREKARSPACFCRSEAGLLCSTAEGDTPALSLRWPLTPWMWLQHQNQTKKNFSIGVALENGPKGRQRGTDQF